MRFFALIAVLLVAACAEGAPPPPLPHGPWAQLNNWGGQWATWQPTQAELPCEITGEIERIEQRLAELDEISEDEWTDALMTDAARLEERRDEQAVIQLAR